MQAGVSPGDEARWIPRQEASDSGWQVRLIDQRARNHEEEWGEWGLGKKTAR